MAFDLLIRLVVYAVNYKPAPRESQPPRNWGYMGNGLLARIVGPLARRPDRSREPQFGTIKGFAVGQGRHAPPLRENLRSLHEKISANSATLRDKLRWVGRARRGGKWRE